MIRVMNTVSLAEAKTHLSRVVDDAVTTHLRTTITKDGKPVVVIMAVDDLEALEATLDVLSDSQAMAAIRESREPDSQWYSQDDIEAVVAARHARED
jgi:antitoxin YefM